MRLLRVGPRALIVPALLTLAVVVGACDSGDAAGTSDTGSTVDTGETGDTGDETGAPDATGDETGDDPSGTKPDETGGDTAETGETGDTDDETGETGDETGDTGETGETGETTGETGSETGETGETGDETGDTGDESGDTGDETGDTGDETGGETGDTGDETGDTGDETGDTDGEGDTGDTGDDTSGGGGDTGETGGECVPSCDGKACGDDGCAGSCGPCGQDEVCVDGGCVGCTPTCGDNDCGDNGCGGSCGTCGDFEYCDDGLCIYEDPCDPNPCTSPPGGGCDGDSVVAYDAEGACSVDGTTIVCEYGETLTPCDGDQICSQGQCLDPAGDYAFSADNSLVSEVAVAGATGCCFDLNGDGEVDNGAGDLINNLGGLLGGGLDIDGAIQDAIDSGQVTVLLDMQGLDDSSNDGSVQLDGFFGYGDGGYLVQPSSFVPETQIPIVSFPGSITGGALLAGPSTFAASIPLSGSVLDIEVLDTWISGKVVTTDGSFAIEQGKLGGLLPMAQLVDAINALAGSMCSCLANGGDILSLSGENSLSCAAGFQFGASTCGAGDNEICTGVADNKTLACIAIGIIKPDIDTDDSGQADAFSVGATFASMPVTIAGVGEDQLASGCGQCSGGPLDPMSGAGHALLFALMFGWLVRRRTA